MIDFKPAIAAAALLLSSAAHAALEGAQVTGSLTFNGGATNYFDPANSFVPAGFGNAAAATVTVGSGTEFGFDDTSNRITADFADSHLLLQQAFFSGVSSPWTISFTSTAFGALTLDSSSFDPNLTYSLLADTITIHYAGTSSAVPQSSASALFDIGPGAALPEPATWAMMLLGFSGIGMALRRQRSTPATA